jgi:hypothetical protein
MSANTNKEAPSASNEKSGDSQESDEPKKKRLQMNHILDLGISGARCQGHMRAALVPHSVENDLKEKRKALKSRKEALVAEEKKVEDDAEYQKMKEEIDKINEKVVRIGGDAPIAMAAAADLIVRECATYAMEQTIASERKLVNVGALHSGDPTSLSVYPLIRDLEAFKCYDPEEEVKLSKQRALENKQKKAEREKAKKEKEKNGKGTKKSAPKTAKKENLGEHGVSTTFHTYVDHCMKTVKKNEKFAKMRISNRFREVLSDIVTQFVARQSSLAKIQVLEFLKVRTLNAPHILIQLKTLYTSYAGDDSEDMKSMLKFVAGKVKRYHDHLRSESDRKFAELSEEKKKELEQKAKEKEEQKLAEKAKKAKEKAIEMAKLAKKLDAELKK